MTNFNPMSFIQQQFQKGIQNNPNIGQNVSNRQQLINALLSGNPAEMERVGRMQAQQMGISEEDVRNGTSQIMQNQFGFKM